MHRFGAGGVLLGTNSWFRGLLVGVASQQRVMVDPTSETLVETLRYDNGRFAVTVIPLIEATQTEAPAERNEGSR